MAVALGNKKVYNGITNKIMKMSFYTQDTGTEMLQTRKTIRGINF